MPNRGSVHERVGGVHGPLVDGADGEVGPEGHAVAALGADASLHVRVVLHVAVLQNLAFWL